MCRHDKKKPVANPWWFGTKKVCASSEWVSVADENDDNDEDDDPDLPNDEEEEIQEVEQVQEQTELSIQVQFRSGDSKLPDEHYAVERQQKQQAEIDERMEAEDADIKDEEEDSNEEEQNEMHMSWLQENPSSIQPVYIYLQLEHSDIFTDDIY